MVQFFQRWFVLVRVGLVLPLLLLAGCTFITSALPPQSTPVPTLARLPSVTPPLPTATPQPTQPATATPEPFVAAAATQANVRSGPGTGFDIVGTLAPGDSVSLRGQQNGWYQVRLASGTVGWVAAQLLAVEPDVANAVPTVQP
ncbi:MAG: SH3 domain-containing protein [Chloroflexaceae bacterium]|jgi:uncharacterized protein YgiM (DUF1202 family)|nr:SH3 domain-containing protein [Chloroflexaceae bacterium]